MSKSRNLYLQRQGGEYAQWLVLDFGDFGVSTKIAYDAPALSVAADLESLAASIRGEVKAEMEKKNEHD